MKSILSLILWAVCASAFSMTMDGIAGSWVVDVEATAPLREASIRRQGPPVKDEQQIAAELATWRKETSIRFIEFAAQTVSILKTDREGTMTLIQEFQITVVGRTDQKSLVLTSKDATLTMQMKGGLLEMEIKSEKMDPIIWILKRAEAKPVPKP
jgi:hypothetical protein